MYVIGTHMKRSQIGVGQAGVAAASRCSGDVAAA